MTNPSETWRADPEILAFQDRITDHFSGMQDTDLARQAGTILEVDQMERGTVPNSSLVGDYRVQLVCISLLEDPLKPESERGFMEMDRTRIGREACVDEFLKRLVSKYAEKFGFVQKEEIT